MGKTTNASQNNIRVRQPKQTPRQRARNPGHNRMAQAMGVDPEKVLDGIIYGHVYNSEHQILTVDHAFKICREENVKLLIVNSVLPTFEENT